jgi:hypothetical protein
MLVSLYSFGSKLINSSLEAFKSKSFVTHFIEIVLWRASDVFIVFFDVRGLKIGLESLHGR